MTTTQVLLSQKYIYEDQEAPFTFEVANVSARDFQHISLQIIASGAVPVATIRIKGTMQDTIPDFDAPSTSDNEWFFIQTKDMENNAYYNGDTGFDITSAGTYGLELNTTTLTWVTVEVSDPLEFNGSIEARFAFKNNY